MEEERRGKDGRGKEERRKEKERGRKKKKKKQGRTEKSIAFLSLCLYLPLIVFIVKRAHENSRVDRLPAMDKNRATDWGETEGGGQQMQPMISPKSTYTVGVTSLSMSPFFSCLHSQFPRTQPSNRFSLPPKTKKKTPTP